MSITPLENSTSTEVFIIKPGVAQKSDKIILRDKKTRLFAISESARTQQQNYTFAQFELANLLTQYRAAYQEQPDEIKLYTTNDHYLTGRAALNLFKPDINTGDWHFNDFFIGCFDRKPGPFGIAGLDLPCTNSLFGKHGIYDATTLIPDNLLLAEYPIHAADHYRATADLLYHYLSIDLPIHFKYYLEVESWFYGNQDKFALKAYINILCDDLSDSKSNKLKAWFDSLDL